MKDTPITWTGDLDDDCHAKWFGFAAHCEAMGTGEWWFLVEWKGARGLDVLWGVRDLGFTIPTGALARMLCEAYMRHNKPKRRKSK